jgi:hypothetical protein
VKLARSSPQKVDQLSGSAKRVGNVRAIDDRERGDRLAIQESEENGLDRGPGAVERGEPGQRGLIGGRCEPKHDIAIELRGLRRFVCKGTGGWAKVIHSRSGEKHVKVRRSHVKFLGRGFTSRDAVFTRRG